MSASISLKVWLCNHRLQYPWYIYYTNNVLTLRLISKCKFGSLSLEGNIIESVSLVNGKVKAKGGGGCPPTPLYAHLRSKFLLKVTSTLLTTLGVTCMHNIYFPPSQPHA